MIVTKHQKSKLPLSPWRRQGFTLIELLVVIAIISLLAAILFPVFGRARDNARRARCMSNFKQIGTAVIQYSQDYDEKLPFQTWVAATPGRVEAFSSPLKEDNPCRSIQPYLKSWEVFACPSVPIVVVGNDRRYAQTSYLWNGVLVPNKARAIASIPDSAGTILLQEYKESIWITYTRPMQLANGGNTYTSWLPLPVYNSQHFGGGNLLFADGHVKWRLPSTIAATEYGLNSTAVGVTSLAATADAQDWAKF